MAPEILLSTKEKGYEGFPVDIWSSGISLYIMLSGTLPFNYKNKKNGNEEEENEENEDEDESISDKSKSKKNDDDNFELQYSIVYKEPKYIEKISDEARDLLKGLLNKDPKKRLTVDQILNHPWLYNFKEKNTGSNKFHLFTKAELIMLSKTFIDYRRANSDDLKENFTLSNLECENNKNKNKTNEENITSKSSILAPYNSIISDYDSNSEGITIKSDDLFNDFNNSKIKLEKDQIIFSKKIKEYNRLYELNNNGEVDNGVLINSKTQSSINTSERSSRSYKKDILDFNISNDESCVVFNENDEIIEIKKKNKKKKEKNNNNNNNKSIDEELEKSIKSNNILNQMSLMGYDKKYVLDCVKKNELCHASAVYYLMMNYENI
jgi:serine/threonine protein kinase